MNKLVKKEIWSWAKAILLTLIIVFICRQFLFAPIKVDGKSMMPTFENNDRVIISKMHKIEPFDLIVFHSPVSSTDYIKRVIGLPGDTIEVKDDILYVNDKKYEEPYLKNNKKNLLQKEKLTEDLKETVPKGSLYVMGDNRHNSEDSRNFGFILKENVVGEVVLRYYPLNQINIPK